MLGKMYKYEFLAMGRFLLPFFIAAAVLSGIACVTTVLQTGPEQMYFSNIVVSIFVLALFVEFAAALIATILRFQNGLLGREGYLSMMLPVRMSTHIWCRLLTAMTWYVFSFLVIIACFMLLLFAFSTQDQGIVLRDALSSFRDLVILSPSTGVLSIVTLLTLAAVFILRIYASLSIGQLVDSHPLLLAFAVFLGFCVLSSIIRGSFTYDHMYYMYSTATAWREALLPLGEYLAECAAYYGITWWILKNRLNLQ
ncbi:MAG: hypothetical protein ACOYJJ_02435 [Anaerovoracaceae bacterium]|jgi:ABC-2 type transport system ATP-binding protein